MDAVTGKKEETTQETPTQPVQGQEPQVQPVQGQETTQEQPPTT